MNLWEHKPLLAKEWFWRLLTSNLLVAISIVNRQSEIVNRFRLQQRPLALLLMQQLADLPLRTWIF